MAESLGYLIKRAQHAFRRALDDELRPLNLTSAQYGALSALEMKPHASNASLARACFVTPQTMIEMIKSLEGAGFVVRQSHPEHGRFIQTILTESGRANLVAAHQVMEGIEKKMLSGVAAGDQEMVAEVLRRCCENLEES